MPQGLQTLMPKLFQAIYFLHKVNDKRAFEKLLYPIQQSKKAGSQHPTENMDYNIIK